MAVISSCSVSKSGGRSACSLGAGHLSGDVAILSDQHLPPVPPTLQWSACSGSGRTTRVTLPEAFAEHLEEEKYNKYPAFCPSAFSTSSAAQGKWITFTLTSFSVPLYLHPWFSSIYIYHVYLLISTTSVFQSLSSLFISHFYLCHIYHPSIEPFIHPTIHPSI